ncbi:hypothetical protein scyTo_0019698 [Scyliorhinus torazame]|uniref:Homeobox domain-containing protein n=1 Tax=Scyliorhinus torazame TaxID=75743 RepID=A0A401PPC5_SCYTO|nr:hypothetical protein [Scyliorhinus torazame]
MSAKRKYGAACPTEWRMMEREPAEGEEAAWARAVGAPEVVYDRIQDRERALGGSRRWMTEDEEDDGGGGEDDDDEEGPEGYHCQICGFHTDQLQPFNIHLHSAHPTVVLQELYGLLGLTGCPIPGLGPSGGPFPNLDLPGGPILGLGPSGGPVPALGPPGYPTPSHGLSGVSIAGLGHKEGRDGGKSDIVHIDLTGEDENGEQEEGPVPAQEPIPASSLKQPGSPAEQAASQEPGSGLELDAEGPLAKAFSRFPYPSPDELARCGMSAGLSAERVRIWFAVQRLRHGISWTPEEVREARDKLWQRPGTLKLPIPPPLALLTDHPLGLVPASGPTESRTSSGGEAQDSVSGQPEGWGGLKKARTSPDGADSPEVQGCPPRVPTLAGERRWRKTKGQLATLKSSFARDRYPDEAEMRRLQARTGLGKSEIKRWFSDSRYQLRGLPASYLQLRRGGGPSWLCSGRLLAQTEDGPARGEGCHEAGGDTLHRLGEVSPVPTAQREVGGVDLSQRKPEVGGGGVEEEEGKTPSPPGGSVVTETAAHCAIGSSMAAETAYRAQASAPSPGRPRKTKEQLAVLKAFFLRSQWPGGDDYTRLVEQTALARADIIQWFGDTRYALKNGQLKWVHRGSTALGAGPPGAEPEPGPGADCGPLEEYLSRHGARLRQDDLYRLCLESRMSAQQVAEWFRRSGRGARPPEPPAASEDGGSEEDRPVEDSGVGLGERKVDHVGGHVIRVTL